MKCSDGEEEEEEEEGSQILGTSNCCRSGAELWSIARKKFRILSVMNMNILHHANTSIIHKGIDLSTSESQHIGILFHPSKGFSSYWDFTISFVLLYSCSISPFSLAFSYTKPGSFLFFCDLLSDFLFLTDICIKLNTSFYNSEKRLSKSSFQVIKHYLTTWFLYDLAASFPYELLTLEKNLEAPHLHIINIVLRLIRTKRLWMVSRILRLFKFFKPLTRFMKNFSSYLSHSMLKLLEMLLRLVFAIHIFSCFILVANEVDGHCPDSWMYRIGVEDSAPTEKYLYALYFMLTTMSTVGYGDITPRTSLEIIISITWMFIAVYFLSFNISNISSLAAESNYKKNTLAQRMTLIETYSKNEGLPNVLKNKMKTEANEKLIRLTHTAEDRQKILSFLPIDLKYEIAFSMQNGVIKDLPFFNQKQKEFIGNIFPLLYQKCLIDNEIVYLLSQHAEEISFVVEGKVSFVYGNGNTPFRYLTVGSFFGDYEVTHDIKRVFGVISKGFTRLLVMGKELVCKFNRDYPSMWLEFKDEAKHRHEVNVKSMSEMIVLRQINSEGKFKEYSSAQIRDMVQVQAGILTHKSLDFTLGEMRKREVVEIRRKVLGQRDVIFSILQGLKHVSIDEVSKKEIVN